MAHSRRAFIAASSVAAVAALGATKPTAAAGPAGLRLPDMPLHDPFMLADRTTRTYYLYTRMSRR